MEIVRKAEKHYHKAARELRLEDCDLDWAYRFYLGASTVSNGDMQEIWAKLLSGEIDNPGNVSFQTIEVLRLMSSSDAKLFEKVCTRSVESGGDVILFPDGDQPYDDVLVLEELGLINAGALITTMIELSRLEACVGHNGKWAIVAHLLNKDNEILTPSIFPLFPLTRAGRELRTICSAEPDFDELKRFALQLAQIKGVEVGVHKILSRNGDKVLWEKENLLKKISS